MIGILVASVAFVVWFWRRRLLSITCVGAYTTLFLLMNYAGVVFAFFGLDPLLIGFQYSQADAWRAIILLHLGIACVWLGVLYTDHFLYRDRPVRWSSFFSYPGILVGMSALRILVLFAFSAGVFFVLFLPIFPRFMYVALHGDIVAKMNYRHNVTTQGSYTSALTVLAYDILPYLSLSLLVISWRTGALRTVSLITVAISCVALFYGLLKQPLVGFALLLAIASNWAWAWRRRAVAIRVARNVKRRVPRRGPLVGFSLAAALLLGLYYWTIGTNQTGSFGQRMELTAGMVVSRVLFRSSDGYIYVASLMPTKMPFVGLTNISTIQWLVGGSFHNINDEIFARANIGGPQGTISLDSLCNYYAQFGWLGLVIGAFLQGLGLALLDRYILSRPRDLGLMVLALFVMKSASYLNGTHVFGAVLGYGGLYSVGLYLILKRKPAARYGEVPQMQADMRSAT